MARIEDPAVARWTRRAMLGAGVGAMSLSASCLRAWADDKLRVGAGSNAVGGLVDAVGGDLVSVELADLDPWTLRIAGATVPVGGRVLLKGAGDARARALDDARNASPVLAAIRDQLSKALPNHATLLHERQKTWMRAFARRTLRWTQDLRQSSVHGRRVRDDFGRIYLLEWAGATVDPAGGPSPTAFEGLAAGPSAATATAYEAYVETLIAALAPSR